MIQLSVSMNSSSMNTNTSTTGTYTVPFFVLRLDQHHSTDGGTCADTSTAIDDATTQQENVEATDLSTSSTSLHQTKALFTVPEHFAAALMVHPIVCCGSLFYLSFDTDVSFSSNTNSKSHTTFVSTTYESVDPHRTASEIATRIATRLQNLKIHFETHGSPPPNSSNLNHDNARSNDTAMVAQQREWASQLLF